MNKLIGITAAHNNQWKPDQAQLLGLVQFFPVHTGKASPEMPLAKL